MSNNIHSANNAELQSLNKTQQRIAEQQQVQIALASKAVAVAEKTNVLLEQQAVERTLEKLERDRQKELKQAAYSVNKDVEKFKLYRTSAKVIFLRRLEDAAISVGLKAVELHEISDKEYVGGVLDKLRESIIQAEAECGQEGMIEISQFYRNLKHLESLKGEISDLQRKIEDAKNNKPDILTGDTIRKWSYQANIVPRWFKGLKGKAKIFFWAVSVCLFLTPLFILFNLIVVSKLIVAILDSWAASNDKSNPSPIDIAALEEKLKKLSQDLEASNNVVKDFISKHKELEALQF